MKISRSAQTLDDFLSVKLRHNPHFSSVIEVDLEVKSTLKLFKEIYPSAEESPFIAGVYLVTVDQPLIDHKLGLDRNQLFNDCHKTLKMSAIDEIAPASISVFGKMCSADMSYSDRLRSVDVIAQLIIRANEMNNEGRVNITRHCESAIDHLRRIGCIDSEIEKEVTKNMSKEDAIKVVEHLDFDVRNIHSLKNLVQRSFHASKGL